MTYGDALRDRVRRAALYRLYARTVGAVQVLYALFFGWIAFTTLTMVVQTEGTFKGAYFPAINLFRIYYGTITLLLFIVSFIGGCGLLGLRRWARRWELAYLFLVSGLVAAGAASAAWRGHEVGFVALIAIVLALPYVPFLFVSPPRYDESHPSGVGRIRVGSLDG